MSYGLLHYPGDVTGSETARPGAVCGGTGDGLTRPWEVIDAEVDQCWCLGVGDPSPSCPECRGTGKRTIVQLQPASSDAIVGEIRRLTELAKDWQRQADAAAGLRRAGLLR